MKTLNQMTQKGDPMLRIMLGDAIRCLLQDSAKANKRRLQDEIIKRLAMSFEFETEFQELQFDLLKREDLAQNQNKFAQAISKEMIQAIQNAAALKGVAIDDEVASRLFATLLKPKSFGLNPTTLKVLNHHFGAPEAFAEVKRKKESWLYIYEMEKLRLYVEFKPNLPKDFKDEFHLIDFKAALKEIEADLKKNKPSCKE